MCSIVQVLMPQVSGWVAAGGWQQNLLAQHVPSETDLNVQAKDHHAFRNTV